MIVPVFNNCITGMPFYAHIKPKIIKCLMSTQLKKAIQREETSIKHYSEAHSSEMLSDAVALDPNPAAETVGNKSGREKLKSVGNSERLLARKHKLSQTITRLRVAHELQASGIR
jgi:hypothetical protein